MLVDHLRTIYQAGSKRDADEWNSTTKAFLLDLEESDVSAKRPPTQMKTIVENYESPPLQCKKEEEDNRKTEQQAPEIRTNIDKEQEFPSTQNPVFEEAELENATPLNLDNEEKFAEGDIKLKLRTHAF
ncbi:hypothetical protein NDU88_004108 [Pleurodeles waltl]|uniref:Uncharacterized protein n=1 Tax=Pleurodeles waltl TaxID=8319 RepID=A0AAV7RKJ7_PLEWA|nr:hypothetical protein NDU88_004108 [Pleurodeles waltl]